MFKPMNATPYDDKRASWPGYFQPKLDGIRCLHDVNESWTRNLKPQKEHIRRWLLQNVREPAHWALDGELMLPRDRFTFQDTVSVVKKYNDNMRYLEYHIYDVVTPIIPHDQAHRASSLLPFVTYGTCVVPVKTHYVSSAEQFHDHCRQAIDAGEEGGIYRSIAGVYKHGSGGRDLMKYKEVEDSEYTIIAVWEGVGKFEGCAVLRFPRPNYEVGDTVTKKNSFGATFPGKIADKKAAWKRQLDLLGLEVTLKYQELTDDGVPRFPVALSVRDYE